MKINQFQPAWIFSLNTDRKDESEVAQALSKSNIKELGGCWYGTAEAAYLTTDPDPSFSRVLKHHGQESVLFLNTQRIAFECYADDEYQLTARSTYLGRFCEVQVAEAMRYDCWTMDTTTGRYYVCRK